MRKNILILVYIGNISGIYWEYTGNILGISGIYIYMCIYMCICICICRCVYIYVYVYVAGAIGFS